MGITKHTGPIIAPGTLLDAFQLESKPRNVTNERDSAGWVV